MKAESFLEREALRKKIQELVFPEGIVVDTTNRTYLSSKVNSLFLAKSQFMKTSGGINKKLPIKSDEESSLVDYRFEPLARKPTFSSAQLNI